MHWRPVTMVIARATRRGKRYRSCTLQKKIDPRGGSEQLGHCVIKESPLETKSKGGAVEIDTSVEIVDVDIDEQLHRARLPLARAGREIGHEQDELSGVERLRDMRLI